MTIGVIAKLTVAEGKNEEFERIFSELVSQVAANEPGNNFYQVHRSRQDPQLYIVLEQYTDQESLDAHGSSDHFRSLGRELGLLVKWRGPT